MTYGIHHITAISSDAQDTIDFYSHILGLRLLKKTVNQDDTRTYHLFFGDAQGSPGMDLTFFPFKPVHQGMHGEGMVNKIMLAVPIGSLAFWRERLSAYSIAIHEDSKNALGDQYLGFSDWDGQILQLVESDRLNPDAIPWETAEIKKNVAIVNFYGVEIEEVAAEPTARLLHELLGFSKIEVSEDIQAKDISVFENGQSEFANLIFLKSNSRQRSVNAAGTVHHIAFRVPSDEVQLEVRKKAISLGLHPTEVIDRFYFKSVYMREPGGVLWEIATDEPGFTADEELDKLGTELALPPFLSAKRAQIESQLEPITKSENIKPKAKLKSLFRYAEFGPQPTDHVLPILFLLHGTGGDEYDLLGLLDEDVKNKYRLVSLRGNISEHGLNRFFRRFAPGKYDQESISQEAEKLQQFISTYRSAYKSDSVSVLGFSNGANMILATLLLHSDTIANDMKKVVLLHPADVLEEESASRQHNLAQITFLVTYGKHDDMISQKESLQVVDLLKQTKAKVKSFDNGAGHNITREEQKAVITFLST